MPGSLAFQFHCFVPCNGKLIACRYTTHEGPRDILENGICCLAMQSINS